MVLQMSKIFEPYQLGEITIKNRILMAPMLMYTGQEDGKVNDLHLAHYSARALGGVGLITTEVVAVEPHGRISHTDLGLWNDSQIDGLKRLADMLRNCGAKSCLQLAHAGRKSNIDGNIFAPSALPYSENYKVPKSLSIEQISEIIEFYRQATIRAVATGFDFLEIHAAHGYLIHEFLSPLTNQRTDQYGGSEENRSKLLLEIISIVKSIWTKPLIVRLSVEDKAGKGGNTIIQAISLCKKLKALGVEMLSISAGGLTSIFDGEIFPGYLIHYAHTIKKEVGITVGCNGSITSNELIDYALNQEQVDFVYIGRELIRNPFFVLEMAKKTNVEPDLAIKTYLRATSAYVRGH